MHEALRSEDDSQPGVARRPVRDFHPATSRRAFLRASAAGLAAAGLLPGCNRPGGTARLLGRDERVIIVGAGLAGLTAAYELAKAGVRARVYESSSRVGGRTFTGRDVVADGLYTELGGEFIDSNHAGLRGLAAELGLDLMDTRSPAESGLIENVFYFDGRVLNEAGLRSDFAPLARRVIADHDRLPETIDHTQRDPFTVELDRVSLAEYLERIGARGVARDLLEAAYVGEFGLDPGEQSALNLVTMLGTAAPDSMELYGESDERFKIRGGNQLVAERLAERLIGQVFLEHGLESIRRRGSRYALTVAKPGGGRTEAVADFVVLTLPFTRLRQVEIGVELPPEKQRVIRELGYGRNAKLFLGFSRRVWREHGFAGAVYMNAAGQQTWDNSRMQAGPAGGLTVYSGGRTSDTYLAEPPERLRDQAMPVLDAAFGGLSAAHNGRTQRFHWSTHPHTLCSYACYRAGQWTTLCGLESAPVGDIHFAGEHCSREFQGFMNGAVETGQAAARTILERLGLEAASHVRYKFA